MKEIQKWMTMMHYSMVIGKIAGRNNKNLKDVNKYVEDLVRPFTKMSPKTYRKYCRYVAAYTEIKTTPLLK